MQKAAKKYIWQFESLEIGDLICPERFQETNQISYL